MGEQVGAHLLTFSNKNILSPRGVFSLFVMGLLLASPVRAIHQKPIKEPNPGPCQSYLSKSLDQPEVRQAVVKFFGQLESSHLKEWGLSLPHVLELLGGELHKIERRVATACVGLECIEAGYGGKCDCRVHFAFYESDGAVNIRFEYRTDENSDTWTSLPLRTERLTGAFLARTKEELTALSVLVKRFA